ncbi:HAMP domain-containing histidine kinase [Prolixibacteraceae bacterium JC049]|nr:HAMP domain-containing histidine kinase [Prolixibacteraceae bacterium JC049]
MLTTEKENIILNDVLSRITHDLRTPNAVLTSNIQMLKEDYPQSEEIELCELALTDFSEMIAQYELANSLIKGRITPTSQSIDYNEIIHQLITTNLFIKNNIQRLNIDISPCSTCFSDSNLVMNILKQVLTNALSYSSSHVYLNIQTNTCHTEIEVKDNGIGIPPKDLPIIKKLFYRGTNIGLRKGSGLGLTIANCAIKLLEGELTISSNTKGGTTVKINIPNGKKENPSNRRRRSTKQNFAKSP